MQNRSLPDLPVLFEDATPRWALEDVRAMRPAPLDIYDVEYLHFHRYMELGYCEAGGGTCYVEDTTFPYRQGDVQVIFPYQRHLSQSGGGGASLWRWLTLDPIDMLFRAGYTEIQQVDSWLRHSMGLWGIIDRDRYPGVAAGILRLFFPECEAPQAQAYLAGCLLQLVVALCAASQGLPRIEVREDSRLARLGPALQLVEDALRQGAAPSADAMAAACGLSPAHFRRVFTAALGLSPKQYLTVCRMRRARKLLLGGSAKVIEVAQAAGYRELSAFNRAFLQFHGITPTAYRAGSGA